MRHDRGNLSGRYTDGGRNGITVLALAQEAQHGLPLVGRYAWASDLPLVGNLGQLVSEPAVDQAGAIFDFAGLLEREELRPKIAVSARRHGNAIA